MATPSRLPSTRRPPGAASGRARPTSMIEPGFSGLPTPTKPEAPKSKRLSLLQFPRSISAEHKKEPDVVERETYDRDIPGRNGSEDTAVDAARQADRRAMPPPPTSRLARVSAKQRFNRKAGAAKEHACSHTIQCSHSCCRQPPQASTFDRNDLSDPQGKWSRAFDKCEDLAAAGSHSQQQHHIHCPGLWTSTHKQRAPDVDQHVDFKPSSYCAIPNFTEESTRVEAKQQVTATTITALPKPPVPTSKFTRPAPATAEEDISVPFDIARQQIELLQLSLIHEASAQTTRQYTVDAKRKLGKRHARLRKDFEAVREAELAQQKLANLKALQAWCPDPSLLAENLQTLARVHKEVVALTHSESRYTGLLAVFEDWATAAEGKMAASSKGFVEPLPGSWREAHASTALKIRSLQREMATLPPLPDQEASNGVETSLQMILGSCRSLVDGILRELDMMAKLEKELLGQEQGRIDGAIGALRLDEQQKHDWVPAWQKTA
ncbi:hypothetical protein MBLNU13_g02378t3 [Cladosporium sp. NU13]